MRAVISGAAGFIGRALRSHLLRSGWQATVLTRNPGGGSAESIAWDPYVHEPELACDPGKLENYDALIHLAGAGIADSRWTAGRKRELRDSRVIGTRNLLRVFAELKQPPKTLLCASAIGFYGDRGQEALTEQSKRGSGFLADLCQEWEDAAQSAAAAGMRVVNLRFGIVLSVEGGALRKMLPPFRLGLGGRLGSGQQWMSWIALADTLRAIEHALRSEGIEGPVNVTAPYPVTNEEFTRVLAHVLHRPAKIPVPEIALKLLLGEMSDALLASTRALPNRLLTSGFEFCYPKLRETLDSVLAGNRTQSQ